MSNGHRSVAGTPRENQGESVGAQRAAFKWGRVVLKKLRKDGPERLERFAYENRRDLTKAEAAMSVILSNLGWRFNIEHPKPKENIILDFLVPAYRLVIEVDGGYHVTRKDRDKQRDRTLVKRGYFVQRFTNEQVLNFPRRTAATLLARIKEPTGTVRPRRLASVKRVRETFVPNLPAVMREAKCR